MNNLQEILNQFAQSKIGGIKEVKISQIERGRLLGIKKGKHNMTDESRLLSKIPTTCPNCLTTGPFSSMKQHHFDKCKRRPGYSNNLIFEKYQNGSTMINISKESSISYPQIKLIIRQEKNFGKLK